MFFTKARPVALLLTILLLSAGITVLAPAPAHADAPDAWQILTPEHSPPARFGHTLVNVDGSLYLFGGFDFSPDPSVLYNDL